MAGQACDGINETSRQAGDAAEILQEVEGGSLGGEDAAHRSGQGRKPVPGENEGAIRDQRLEIQPTCLERIAILNSPNHHFHRIQARQHSLSPGHENRTAFQVRWNDRLAGEVPARAKVFRQRQRYELTAGQRFLR